MKNPFSNGQEYWQHLKQTSDNFIAAYTVGSGYISALMRQNCTDEDKQFARELFVAMFEDVAELAIPARMVYPYTIEKATERLESTLFHESRERNNECAKAIDTAISASCYETYRYNLELAAMTVVQEYGFNRVNAVLAYNLKQHESDGRYSRSNKEWAREIHFQDQAFCYATMNAHPLLLEEFTGRTRYLHDILAAERFMLPGQHEKGTTVHGYDVFHAIAFDDKRGFAIGLNPNAAAPLVCWQFTTLENGQRDFYWGNYTDDLAGVTDNYTARVLSHMSGGEVREVVNPLAAAEMALEQNYNQIDGRINNEKTEAERDAPARGKPSVLAQLREAKKAPPAPRKEPTLDKEKQDLER